MREIKQLENYNIEWRCFQYYLAKKLLENGELKESFEILKKIEPKVKSGDNQNLQDSYYALLIRYFAMTENWKEILPAFENIIQKNDNAIYFAALANFNLSKYNSVIKLLENMIIILKEQIIQMIFIIYVKKVISVIVL